MSCDTRAVSGSRRSLGNDMGKNGGYAGTTTRGRYLDPVIVLETIMLKKVAVRQL